VLYVNWDQADAFCRWTEDGRSVRRLPTEAEWEKAARGVGTGNRIYPWGDDPPNCDRANYGGLAGCVGDTEDVGAEGGDSPYGVKNMAGNVSEWVSDSYSETYYRDLCATGCCESGCVNPEGPGSGTWRVSRGGSWSSPIGSLRVASRTYGGFAAREATLGFRCAVSVR
jgi:formylglycine-generating enzyme required for sulfatase activity